jgi:hypothetical protein
MADHDRAIVRRAYSSADIGKQAGISSDMESPVEYVAIKSPAFTTARVKLLSKWRVHTGLLNESADLHETAVKHLSGKIFSHKIAREFTRKSLR